MPPILDGTADVGRWQESRRWADAFDAVFFYVAGARWPYWVALAGAYALAGAL